jgi:hypothetical protein
MPFLSLLKKNRRHIASCISRTNRRKREQNRRRCSQKLEKREREREIGVSLKPKRKRCFFKVLADGVFNKQWAGKLINEPDNSNG